MQGSILFVLLFSALVHCKHLCFTRTGTESSQVLRTRFSPVLFFALKSLVTVVTCEVCFLHSNDGSFLLADVQLFFKNTPHVRIHHTVDLLLLTPERFSVLFHIKARHLLLPFIYMQNSP